MSKDEIIKAIASIRERFNSRKKPESTETDGAPIGNHNAAGRHEQGTANKRGGPAPKGAKTVPMGDLNIMVNTEKKRG